MLFSAIREDEIAAVAMGINTKYYKVLAMVISAVICSIAGSFQAVFCKHGQPGAFKLYQVHFHSYYGSYRWTQKHQRYDLRRYPSYHSS